MRLAVVGRRVLWTAWPKAKTDEHLLLSPLIACGTAYHSRLSVHCITIAAMYLVFAFRYAIIIRSSVVSSHEARIEYRVPITGEQR